MDGTKEKDNEQSTDKENPSSNGTSNPVVERTSSSFNNNGSGGEDDLNVQAAIFKRLEEAQIAKRAAEDAQEFINVKVDPAECQLFIKETELPHEEAEKFIKLHQGDIRATALNFICSFPQLKIYREHGNVLGP